MLRFLYCWLLRLHPPRFRERFAEEMTSIFDQVEERGASLKFVADAFISLVRQWTTRSEYWIEEATVPVGADGVPLFFTLESSKPRKNALIAGAVATWIVYSTLFFAIRHSRVHLVYLPQVSFQSEAGTNGKPPARAPHWTPATTPRIPSRNQFAAKSRTSVDRPVLDDATSSRLITRSEVSEILEQARTNASNDSHQTLSRPPLTQSSDQTYAPTGILREPLSSFSGIYTTARPTGFLHGQPDDSSTFVAKLLQNRYGLSVRDGQFSGAGSPVLKSAVAQSRFVLVGETHGLAETSKFWTGVCNAAGPEGFRTMAIEEGPLVAAELERWARQPDGETQLAAFEKQYPEALNINNTHEEFEMLQRCAASARGGNFRLWGLNQEGLGAGELILGRILEARPPSESGRLMRQLLQKNDDAYAKFLQSGRISDLFMISADDKELAAGAALLEKEGTPQTRSLFASLIQSHEINRAWPANPGRRSQLMKTLFTADYAEAARLETSPPKVLLKFGAYHIHRGFNPMRDSGLGNYVAEFADGQGAQSLHICLMAVKGSVGQPGRLRPFNLQDDSRSRYLQPILANLLESEWTLFDLHPLRENVRRKPEIVSSELATLIFGIDILVMVPEATPSTRVR